MHIKTPGCVCTRFHIVDWELFGIGDPNWDVGSLLGSLYYFRLHRNQFEPELAELQTDAWVQVFLQTYSQLAGHLFDLDKTFLYASWWLVWRARINLMQSTIATQLEVACIYLASILANGAYGID